jgi:RNA polymerase sigma factor (TIGR02999 family)
MSVMSDEIQTTVSRLVHELQNGNRAALDELFPLIYEELRALAHRHRRRWHGDTTLNTTALVHELYLKLDGQNRMGSSGRAHFFAVASKAMRHILSNYAREHRAKKRGDGATRVSLDEMTVLPEEPHTQLSEQQADMLAELDEALRRLEQVDQRRSEVVECRFYGGMTVEETAVAIGISPRTVKRDWQLAQAWLHREIKSNN